MTSWRPPILETERLYLRPIEESDADSIFAYASIEEVAMHTTWYAHTSMEDTMDFIHNYVFANYEQEVPEPWGITLKENPEMVIGTIGVTKSSRMGHEMRLHYGLSDTFWGQSIIPEAGRCILNHVFDTYQPKRVYAYCNGDNQSSARALEKMGFISEGIARCALHTKGGYHDAHNFGMLDSDWSDLKAKSK